LPNRATPTLIGQGDFVKSAPLSDFGLLVTAREPTISVPLRFVDGNN
jgi:hypothetical protein